MMVDARGLGPDPGGGGKTGTVNRLTRGHWLGRSAVGCVQESDTQRYEHEVRIARELASKRNLECESAREPAALARPHARTPSRRLRARAPARGGWRDQGPPRGGRRVLRLRHGIAGARGEPCLELG